MITLIVAFAAVYYPTLNALLSVSISAFSKAWNVSSTLSFAPKLRITNIYDTNTGVGKISATPTTMESSSKGQGYAYLASIPYKVPERVIKIFQTRPKRVMLFPPALELPGGGYQCSVM